MPANQAFRFARCVSISWAVPRVLVVLTCLVLSACDDGSNVVITDASDSPQIPQPGGDPTENPGEGPGTDPVENPTPIIPGNQGVPTLIVADSSVTSLPGGTRAKAYTGNFDSASGVFIIDDADRLIGLADTGQNQSVSIRANLDSSASPTAAVVSRFSHDQQASINSQVSTAVLSAFAQSQELQSDTSMDINDGVQINSVAGDIPFALQAANEQTLTPVSAASLQGQWTSDYSLCDSNGNQCSTIAFSLLIADSAFTGSASVLASDGTDLLPSPVSGTLAQRGLVMDIEMRWNTYRYNGFAFVQPSAPSQLQMVLTTDSEIADERMLVLTLVRLQS